MFRDVIVTTRDYHIGYDGNATRKVRVLSLVGWYQRGTNTVARFRDTTLLEDKSENLVNPSRDSGTNVVVRQTCTYARACKKANVARDGGDSCHAIISSNETLTTPRGLAFVICV